MLDCIIRQGLVYDGLGRPPYRRDLGIAGRHIALVREHIELPARREYDAGGLWLTPGFIDIHTHYDLELEVAPGLPESVRHGVTTVVIGNCSLSLTVGEPQTLGDIFLRVETLPVTLVRKWLAQAVSWDRPAAYIEHLRSLPLGPNVAPLLGHSALRATVMGLERSLGDAATAAELERMKRLALEALESGCIGISVDMVHWHKVSGAYAGRALPSHHADYAEYALLADLCRQRDAVFQATPDPRNWKTFLSLLRLGMGVFRPPLRLTLLAALDMDDKPQLWRVFPLVLFFCNRLLGGNLRFQTLTEPFTLYADGPLTPLFEEFECGVLLNNGPNAEARRALWRDPAFRRAFRQQWRSGGPKTFHRDLARMQVLAAPEARWVGKSFADIARERGGEPLEVFCDLLEHYDDAIRWVSTGANRRPRIRERLMAHPQILPGFTDAGAHCRHLACFDGALSLLRQAYTTGFMPMERAVQRVTAEPAHWFNLSGGIIREGAQADLVLLRPDALGTEIPAPIAYPDPLLDGAMRMVKRGSESLVASVWIAGQEVVAEGRPLPLLGSTPLGTVLTGPRPAPSPEQVMARYRNRIQAEPEDHPFQDYWEVFVLKHRHPGNVWLHCLAVLILYVMGIALIATANLWLLLLAPLSQATGLLGHALFEPNHIDPRDLVFSRRASYCLNRLFWSVLRGRYFAEAARLGRRYESFRRARETVTEWR